MNFEIINESKKLTVEGNVIPNSWYHYLKNEKGKIQTNAALILADIFSWYQPIPIYNYQTSQLIGYSKGFKEDLPNLSYKYFFEKFGFSETQARNALKFLEKKKLIFREYRNITINNRVLNDVMYIGIFWEKISEISNFLANPSSSPIKDSVDVNHSKIDNQVPPSIIPPQTSEITNLSSSKKAPSLTSVKQQEKDWSVNFSEEQKTFLEYMLNIKPEIGIPIEKHHATWWIKKFGIEKIKVGLQVYLEQVEKAKQDSTVPMPQHIGRYVRNAINKGLTPKAKTEELITPPGSEKSQWGVTKTAEAPNKNATHTYISMISMPINEVNEKQSLTFHTNQKKEELPKEKQNLKTHIPKQEAPAQANKSVGFSKKSLFSKNTSLENDWKKSFTPEERKCLTNLVNIKPELGTPIEEKHATWWIKKFGIEKIKIALQVYWQQVEKSKKNPNIPMPRCIGAYVKNALEKGLQPCIESHRQNKAFAENLKKQMGWSTLTLTEKYCRADDLSKEWYYNMPQELFEKSIKETFEYYTQNYCQRISA